MAKKFQLFLLPFAGGSSASFNKLFPLLDDQIEPHTIEYSGRNTRRDERFIERYDDFVIDAAEQIKSMIDDRDYAILGYSLGSAVAYEIVIKHLVGKALKHMFICARGSLTRCVDTRKYADMSDDEFLERMIELGGIDERILKNKRFLDIYLKPIRADYIIWGQYSFVPGMIPCDATAIYSQKDSASENIRDWEQLVDGKIDFCELGDNHFFIFEHWQETADIINSRLEKYL